MMCVCMCFIQDLSVAKLSLCTYYFLNSFLLCVCVMYSCLLMGGCTQQSLSIYNSCYLLILDFCSATTPMYVVLRHKNSSININNSCNNNIFFFFLTFNNTGIQPYITIVLFTTTGALYWDEFKSIRVG